MYVYILTLCLQCILPPILCVVLYTQIIESLNNTIELCFFFATVKCDIGSSSGVVFKRHQGVKLQNYVIKRIFPVSSVIACLKVCADIQECFSVNYFVPHGLCELNSYNYMLSDPINAAGYVWYDCAY